MKHYCISYTFIILLEFVSFEVKSSFLNHISANCSTICHCLDKPPQIHIILTSRSRHAGLLELFSFCCLRLLLSALCLRVCLRMINPVVYPELPLNPQWWHPNKPNICLDTGCQAFASSSVFFIPTVLFLIKPLSSRLTPGVSCIPLLVLPL